MKATILILVLVFGCAWTACAVEQGNAPDESSAASASTIDENWQTGCDPDDPFCDAGPGQGGGGSTCRSSCNVESDCWGCPATYSCIYDGSGSGLGKVCAPNVIACGCIGYGCVPWGSPGCGG